MSHSQAALVASFSTSQTEASAAAPETQALLNPSPQVNIQAASAALVSTPTRNYSSNVAQPTSIHTKLSMRPLYSPATPPGGSSTEASPLSSASASTSLGAPLVSFSPLSNKRSAFLNKHMRSKSSHYPGMIGSPLSAIAPNSPTRMNAPPLFRSTSLPAVSQYERSERKFVPTLGAPPSPSSMSPTSWRSGMPIPSPSDRGQNYRMRERSPSRRPSSSSSGLYSTSPKASFFSLHHHSSLPWAADTFPSSSSPSLTSGSSGPSTPSSIRSRSPSISSLETIPDSPDAEAEALEAERLAEEARKLAEEEQAVGMARSASAGSTSGGAPRRRSHVGIDGSGVAQLRMGGQSGMSAEEKRRKRWSVCGGEKRADLELETIWEDKVVSAQSPPQQSISIVGSLEYELERESTGFAEGEMI